MFACPVSNESIKLIYYRTLLYILNVTEFLASYLQHEIPKKPILSH